MLNLPWQRLIRFVSVDGRTLHGEPILPSPDFDVGKTTESTCLQARVLSGSNIFDTSGQTKVTDEVATVKTLLGPLTEADVPIIRCIGLNYSKHIREAGRTPPPFPSLFFKPSTCVHDHGKDVEVPRICQDEQADYEGELCVVIGKDAKDVKKEDAFEYIAGLTCGNDISSRKLQRDPKLAGGVPQWGFSKGFDTYAPMGPCLVRPDVLGDEEGVRGLRMKTLVDGEVRQDTGIDDLLFGCAYLVEYLSQGTTLRKGTVIMTGTPGGVGFGMSPPRWLREGNVMEVEIQGIGTLRNGVRYV